MIVYVGICTTGRSQVTLDNQFLTFKQNLCLDNQETQFKNVEQLLSSH